MVWQVYLELRGKTAFVSGEKVRFSKVGRIQRKELGQSPEHLFPFLSAKETAQKMRSVASGFGL